MPSPRFAERLRHKRDRALAHIATIERQSAERGGPTDRETELLAERQAEVAAAGALLERHERLVALLENPPMKPTQPGAFDLDRRRALGLAIEEARAVLDIVEEEGRTEMSVEERIRYDAAVARAEEISAELPAHEAAKGEAFAATIASATPHTPKELTVNDALKTRPAEPRISAGAGPTMKAFDNTPAGREAAYLTGQFLHGVLLGNPQAQDWLSTRMDVAYQVRAAHSAGVNTAGGVLVPEEFSRTIIRLVETYGIARQLARVITTNTDSINVPRRTGGLTAAFTAENASISESDSTWDNVMLAPKKLAILTRMSTELADDAIVSVVDMLAQECAYSFAAKEDACLLIGDGTSTYGGMVGAFVKAIDGSHPYATVAAASGHDTFGELDLDDLISLMALIPTYARVGSTWLCSPEAKAAVFDSLRAAAGGITSADISGGFNDSFLGHRIILSPHLPAGLTTDYTAAAMLGFGNLSLAATIASRTQIRVQTSPDRYFEFDQVGLRATERFDCVVHDLGSATVKSPFAVLTGGAG